MKTFSGGGPRTPRPRQSTTPKKGGWYVIDSTISTFHFKFSVLQRQVGSLLEVQNSFEVRTLPADVMLKQKFPGEWTTAGFVKRAQ